MPRYLPDMNLNPMGNVYANLMEILQNLTIKYVRESELNETLEKQKAANQYLDAVNKRDDFWTYVNYSTDELTAVGITDKELIKQVTQYNNTFDIPDKYHEALLLNRRAMVIENYVEENDYYRMLNGLPNLDEDEKEFFYITEAMSEKFGISNLIPIHKLQDYYNKIDSGLGDTYVALIEGSGYIDKLIEAHPDKKYLKYFGSNRIPLTVSRPAKNFQILQLKPGNIKHIIYSEFLQIYEQCREYFIQCVYIPEFSDFIDRYDNFIALCIMVMTIQQLVVEQMKLTVNREFFDVYAVRMLYQAYNIPYNMYLDEDSQKRIAQNLNILIQNKATDKGLIMIGEVLGFGNNFSIYKYYLSKEHKLDSYGVPIFKETTRFNDDTGEMDIVPDYEAMYKLYFHRETIDNDNFIESFNDSANNESYEEITQGDPYWIEDTNLWKRVWETEYNFVESKYLGLTISYKISNMMFDNILLLKLIIEKENEINDLRLTLPKITGSINISLFDTILLLICLTCAKHNLTGEIITIPDQVLNVVDFMNNVDGGDEFLVDTFAFDFSVFNTPHYDRGYWLHKYAFKVVDDDTYDELIEEYNQDISENKKPFRYAKYSVVKNDIPDIAIGEYVEDRLEKLYLMLGEDAAAEMKKYISILSVDTYAGSKKADAFNQMYLNIKNLYKFFNYWMTYATDRKTYAMLRRLYNAAFYAKEVKDVFTITGEETGKQRTAWNFFEYLHYRNPYLYNAVFDFNPLDQYKEYVSNNNLDRNTYKYSDFLIAVENGEIKLKYDVLKNSIVDNKNIKDEMIYYYINHIVSRLQILIKDIKYIYMLGDMATPLEDLLVKLIIFFKSYTTELVNLDNIYIMDFKPINMIRMFEEIAHMEKTLVIPDDIWIPFSDIVRILSEYLLKDGKLLEAEKFVYTIWLIFDNRFGVYNSIRMKDVILDWIKTTQIDDGKDDPHFFDLAKGITSDYYLKDNNLKIKDLCTIYYTDPEEESEAG